MSPSQCPLRPKSGHAHACFGLVIVSAVAFMTPTSAGVSMRCAQESYSK